MVQIQEAVLVHHFHQYRQKQPAPLQWIAVLEKGVFQNGRRQHAREFPVTLGKQRGEDVVFTFVVVIKIARADVQLECDVTGCDITLPALIEELGGDDQNAFGGFHGVPVYRAQTVCDAPRTAGRAAY